MRKNNKYDQKHKLYMYIRLFNKLRSVSVYWSLYIYVHFTAINISYLRNYLKYLLTTNRLEWLFFHDEQRFGAFKQQFKTKVESIALSMMHITRRAELQEMQRWARARGEIKSIFHSNGTQVGRNPFGFMAVAQSGNKYEFREQRIVVRAIGRSLKTSPSWFSKTSANNKIPRSM